MSYIKTESESDTQASARAFLQLRDLKPADPDSNGDQLSGAQMVTNGA